LQGVNFVVDLDDVDGLLDFVSVMAMTTVADWAEALGVSRQAAYQAIKRCGIPRDHGMVDAELATYLYNQRTQQRVRSARRAPAGTSGAERRLVEAQLERAQSLGRLAAAADGAIDPALLGELREAMCCVPLSHRAQLRLSVATWDVLAGDVIAAVAERGGDQAQPAASVMDDDDQVGQLIYLAAIGQVRVNP